MRAVRLVAVTAVAAMAASVMAAVAPSGAVGESSAAAVDVACPAQQVPTAGFEDVAPTDVHRRSIDCLAWWEIALGTSDGTYHPDATVNRAQTSSFLARLVVRSGGHLGGSPADQFTDDDGSVHHFAVNRLAEAGVVNGLSERTFGPVFAVTREQLVSLLVRTYEERTGRTLPTGPDAFTDDEGSVHEVNIDKAAAAGLAKGLGGGLFGPGGPSTRAQTASFLARTLQLVAVGGYVQETPATLRAASALRGIEDCDELLGHLKERALENVGAFGLVRGFGDDVVGTPGPAPAAPPGGEGDLGGGRDEATPQAGTDFSGTNVQEQGVDEADVVKTDGQRIVTIIDGVLRVIDVTGSTPQLVGTLTLPDDTFSNELFLQGNRVLIVGSEQVFSVEPGPEPRPTEPPGGEPGEPDETEPAPAQGASVIAPGFFRPKAVLMLVDISNPASPRIESTLRIDGFTLASRLIGNVARVVLRTEPAELPFVFPQDEDDVPEAERRNREIVEASTPEDWLPGYSLDDGQGTDESTLLGCDQVSRPPEFSGLGLLSVLTVDLQGELQPSSAVSVLAAGDTVYASPTSLYVATNRWDLVLDPVLETGQTVTEIHSFAITDPTTAAYRGSGKVAGYVLNSFALSEHEGLLRVATTTAPPWFGADEGATSESRVTVLELTNGTLTRIGEVTGLGKGEQIFGVRFVGDTAYVVTFERKDPLFVVDLSDPTAPVVRGELEVLGFSAYLHPATTSALIGVGQDATEEGFTTGFQISLFDVSDPGNPTRLHQATIEGGSSEVDFDHHAFLHWPPTKLVVVPISRFSFTEGGAPAGQNFIGAVAFEVDRTTGIRELGRVTHGDPDDGQEKWPGILRSLVIGDRLYTLSSRGLKASSLSTLQDQAFLAFS